MKKGPKAVRETEDSYRTRRAPASKSAKAVRHKDIVIHKIGVEGKPIIYNVPDREWLKIIERDAALYEKYARHLNQSTRASLWRLG
jgi:hypothetical protein